MISRITFRHDLRHVDNRGSFARLVDTEWGFPLTAQISLSTNTQAGTLRGMHAMVRSAEEYKAVTCLSGHMLDVVVDLRPESEDYLKVKYFELTADNPGTVLIPPGCVHGFITLADNTHVLYSMSIPFSSSLEVGFRWDDPLLGIKWPSSPAVISPKDAEFPRSISKPQL